MWVCVRECVERSHCCELVLPVALISFSSRTEEVLLNDGMPRYMFSRCFDPEGEPIDSLSLSFSLCVYRSRLCVDVDEETGEFVYSYLLRPDRPGEKYWTLWAYCLNAPFHPFGPSAGTDTHAAFGDAISPSGHPELLFRLLALLPKVQLTIVSCVPSKSCSSPSSSSSSSSRWLSEAELPLLLYCNATRKCHYY